VTKELKWEIIKVRDSFVGRKYPCYLHLSKDATCLVGSARASGLKDRVFTAVQPQFTEAEGVKSVCDGGSDVRPQGNTRTRETRGKCGHRRNLARNSFFFFFFVLRSVAFSSILPSLTGHTHRRIVRPARVTASEMEMRNAVTIFKLRDVRWCLRATRKIMRRRSRKSAAFTVTRAFSKCPPCNLS